MHVRSCFAPDTGAARRVPAYLASGVTAIAATCMAVGVVLAFGSANAGAQIIRGAPRPDTARMAAADTLMTPFERARMLQAGFERFRRANLPSYRGGRPGNCDERVGRFCYWYDETAQQSPELRPVAERRLELAQALDSLGRAAPADNWILAQRVRYLVEDARPGDALNAARECTGGTWWCDVMTGFSLHMLGEYERADSVYAAGIAKMLPRDQCAWNDISMLLDPDALQGYRRMACDDPKRRVIEKSDEPPPASPAASN